MGARCSRTSGTTSPFSPGIPRRSYKKKVSKNKRSKTKSYSPHYRNRGLEPYLLPDIGRKEAFLKKPPKLSEEQKVSCPLCFKTIEGSDKTYLIPCYHAFHKKCLCEKMANDAARGRTLVCIKCIVMAMTGEKQKPVDFDLLDPKANYIFARNGPGLKPIMLDSPEGSPDDDSSPQIASPKLRTRRRGNGSL